MVPTLEEAGYAYVHFDKIFQIHILYNKEEDRFETWVKNKNHAGHCMKWKNTELEYCGEHRINPEKKKKILTMLRKRGKLPPLPKEATK